MDWKKNLLLFLSVCLGGVILYNIGVFSGKGVSRPAPGRMSQPLPGLKIDILATEKALYRGVRRDIFSPLVSNVQKTLVGKIQPATMSPPQVLPEPIHLSELQLFASEVRFMGFLDSSVRKTAFVMRGPDVYMLKRGDSVNRKFMVEDVSGLTITLKDNETGEEAKIQLPQR